MKNLTEIFGYLCGVQFENLLPGEARDAVCASEAAGKIRALGMFRTCLVAHPEYYTHLVDDVRKMDADPLAQKMMGNLRRHGIEPVAAGSLEGEWQWLNHTIEALLPEVETLFPEDVWPYIQASFSSEGISFSEAVANYNSPALKHVYPYGKYINLHTETEGFILGSDEQLKTALGVPGDATGLTVFCSPAQEVCVFVDCENANPIKLLGTLASVSEGVRGKLVVKLYHDPNAAPTWEQFAHHADNLGVKVQTVACPRVNDHKSLTDLRLVAGVIKAVSSGMSHIVIVSSDSDYWALLEECPKTAFFVLYEERLCGVGYRQALEERHVGLSSVDGQEQHPVCAALIEEAADKAWQETLCRMPEFNIKSSFTATAQMYGITNTDCIDEQFERLFDTMQVGTDADGVLRLS